MAQLRQSVTFSGLNVRKYIKAAILVIVLLAIVALGIKSWRIYTATQSMLGDVRTLKSLASTHSDATVLSQVDPLLEKTHNDAVVLREEVALFLPLTPYLRWVPTYGGDIAAVEPILDTAVELTVTASHGYAAFEPIITEVVQGQDVGSTIVQQLASARPQLVAAQQAALRANNAWAHVSFISLSPAAKRQLEQVNLLIPLLDPVLNTALAASEAAPAMLPLTPDSVQQLAAAKPMLQNAQTASERASASWSQVKIDSLPEALQKQARQVSALTSLLVTGTRVAVTLSDIAAPLAPIIAPNSNTKLSNVALINSLVAAKPQLSAAKQSINQASEDWARISITDLPPQLQEHAKSLSMILPQLRDGIDLALVLPTLLGADAPHEYLILAQNPDELRATGGFLSSAGVIRFDHGAPTVEQLNDASNVDDLANHPYPDPPEPLLKYMAIELWLFRDSNWSPDFPTSAQTASQLYELGKGRTIRDVIAFDPTVLQLLLSTVGPISVEGIATPITDQNVTQYMHSQWNLNPGLSSESFIGPLSSALLSKITEHLPELDLSALSHALGRALDEGHLQIAVHDPDAAALFGRHNWDGSVRPGTNDFLMVVDSNVGYNKVVSNINEKVSYAVDLSDAVAPTATVRIQHMNRPDAKESCWELDDRSLASRRYEDWMVGCFRDYLRVLVPDGSRLLDSNTGLVPAELTWSGIAVDGTAAQESGPAGTNVLNTFLVVPPGQTHDTMLHYALPATVMTHDSEGTHYRLALQKQAGRNTVPYSISVTLPRGATVVSTVPKPVEQHDQLLSFEVNDARLQTIDITFK